MIKYPWEVKKPEKKKNGLSLIGAREQYSSMAMRSLGKCDQESGHWVLFQVLSLSQSIQVY